MHCGATAHTLLREYSRYGFHSTASPPSAIANSYQSFNFSELLLSALFPSSFHAEAPRMRRAGVGRVFPRRGAVLSVQRPTP